MKWFNNLKIKQKLVICFLIVSLFIAVVGTIGTSSMDKITSNSNILYSEDFQALKNLQEFNTNTLHARLEILNILNSKDLSQINQTKANIDTLRKQNDEILKIYEQTNLGDDESKIYQEVKNDLKDYRNSSDKIISLLGDGKYDDALKASEEGATIREKLTDNIDKLVQIIEQEAIVKNDSNNAIRKTSSYLMLIITVLGFIMSILLGVIVATIISKNLRKALIFAKSLENGDLTQVIELNTKDEIGTLAKALNHANMNIRKLISEIIDGANDISSSGEELSATTQEVSSKMKEIDESTEQISKGVQDLSAITEEVSASSQ
jgi:methyl-accepting chemotaxis protein